MDVLRAPSSPARRWQTPLRTGLAAVGLLLGILAAIFLSALFFMLVVLVALLWSGRLLLARRWRSPVGHR
jgi:hypothetical protein